MKETPLQKIIRILAVFLLCGVFTLVAQPYEAQAVGGAISKLIKALTGSLDSTVDDAAKTLSKSGKEGMDHTPGGKPFELNKNSDAIEHNPGGKPIEPFNNSDLDGPVFSNKALETFAKKGDVIAEHKSFIYALKSASKSRKPNYRLSSLVVFGLAAGSPALAIFHLRTSCAAEYDYRIISPQDERVAALLPSREFCQKLAKQTPDLFAAIDREKQEYVTDTDLNIDTIKLIVEEIKVIKNKGLREVEYQYYKQLASDQMIMKRKFKLFIYHKLGRLLESGHGIEKNIAQAYSWYLKAAKQGEPQSQLRLAEIISRGECACALKDNVKALSWALLASNKNQVINYLRKNSGKTFLARSTAQKEMLINSLNKKQVLKAKEHSRALLDKIKAFEKNPSSYVVMKAPATDPQIDMDPRNIDPGKSFALVIGIGEYKYLPKLESTLHDAKGVSAILKNKYHFQVDLVLNPTRKEMYAKLNNYLKRLKEDENFLIYYAGHGVIDFENAYWQPSDGKPKDDATWVPVQKIRSIIKGIKSKHVIVVADACFSATIFKTRGLRIAPVDSDKDNMYQRIKNLKSKKSRIAITSGDLNVVSDTSAASIYSPFAERFLSILDQNTRVLEAMFLYNKLRAGISEDRPLYNPQYAVLYDLGHEGGDFIFLPKGKQ